MDQVATVVPRYDSKRAMTMMFGIRSENALWIQLNS